MIRASVCWKRGSDGLSRHGQEDGMAKGSKARFWAVMCTTEDEGDRPIAFPLCWRCAHNEYVVREVASGWGVNAGEEVRIEPLTLVDHRRGEQCSECNRWIVSNPVPAAATYGGNVFDFVRREG